MDARFWIALILGCLAAADVLRRRAVSNWISLGALAVSLLYHLIRHGLTRLLMASAGAEMSDAA